MLGEYISISHCLNVQFRTALKTFSLVRLKDAWTPEHSLLRPVCWMCRSRYANTSMKKVRVAGLVWNRLRSDMRQIRIASWSIFIGPKGAEQIEPFKVSVVLGDAAARQLTDALE